MVAKARYIDFGADEVARGPKPIPALKTLAAVKNHADLKGRIPVFRTPGTLKGFF